MYLLMINGLFNNDLTWNPISQLNVAVDKDYLLLFLR